MAALYITKIVLLSLCTAAVSVSVPVVRREQTKLFTDEVSLTARGQVLGAHGAQELDFCDVDFPLGPEKSNNCCDPANEIPLDQKECKQAAIEAGADVHQTSFEIPSEFFSKRPKGCFAREDTETEAASTGGATACAGGVCYEFNNCVEGQTCGDASSIERGTPVCKRQKVHFSTFADGVHGPAFDAAATDEANLANYCPDPAVYEPIKNEADCHALAGCISEDCGNANVQFRADIVNASEYYKMPKWCFLANEENHQAHGLVKGCAYFNVPLSDTATAPTAPVGIPLCKVKLDEINTFSASQTGKQCAAGAAGAATAAAATCPATSADGTCGKYTCQDAAKKIDVAKCDAACAAGSDCDADCCKDKVVAETVATQDEVATGAGDTPATTG